MAYNFNYERKHTSIEKYYILEGVYGEPWNNIPVRPIYFEMDDVENNEILQNIISYLMYFVNYRKDREHNVLHVYIREYLLNTYNIVIRWSDIKKVDHYTMVLFNDNNTQYTVTPKYEFEVYKKYLMRAFSINDGNK